jgi:hypothetical protein
LKYEYSITTKINHLVCEELKEFQYQIALAAIAQAPDKKLMGRYHYSWDDYPSIYEGYHSYTVDNCPKCGLALSQGRKDTIKRTAQHHTAELHKKNKSGCLVFLVVSVLFIIVFSVPSMCSGNSSNSSNKSSTPVVSNSGLTSSVYQVKSWLKTNAKDPDSLDYMEWSAVQKTNTGDFRVRVKYRAKNSLGGYVVENKLFTLDSRGKVISVVDY